MSPENKELVARLRRHQGVTPSGRLAVVIVDDLIEAADMIERLDAALRAEQAARAEAEAQRDRLLGGLSSMVSAFGVAGCPACSGDCSAANPPVAGCPLRVLLEARAALAEIGTPPTGWQPIESGNGRMIVSGFEFAEGPARWVAIATLRDNGRWYEDEASEPLHPPTHCMPLPAPPTGGDR